ncbi:MAG: hypothetical protein WCF95_07760 [bacterium]
MELIFAKEILLHPKDSKTNITLPFIIESDFERLEVHFSYAPKELKDKALSLEYINVGMKKYAPGDYRLGYKNSDEYLPVLSLITLSLDSPIGYIGCVHRHNPDQTHILSEKFSSPGFINQKPIKGTWQAVVNVHAVVTENCTCQIEVFGFGESEVLL